MSNKKKDLFNPKFIEELKKNPEQALKDVGIDPTPEILDAINKVDLDSVKDVAEAFGDTKAFGG